MTPGPIRIARISPAGPLVKIFTIASGNTFGARYWTDGRCEAPMLPEEHWLRRCPTSGELFWVDECETIAEEEMHEGAARYADVPFAKKPAPEDFRQALATGIASSAEKEKYLRTRLWWATNDLAGRVQVDVSAEPAFQDNLRKLRALLDLSDPAERLRAAEISRELGEFDRAAALLDFQFPEDQARMVSFIKELIRDRIVVVREIA